MCTTKKALHLFLQTVTLQVERDECALASGHPRAQLPSGVVVQAAVAQPETLQPRARKLDQKHRERHALLSRAPTHTCSNRRPSVPIRLCGIRSVVKCHDALRHSAAPSAPHPAAVRLQSRI